MGKMILGLKTGLATGVLFSLMATSSFAAQVTEEKAKSIALENAGVLLISWLNQAGKTISPYLKWSF